MKYLETLNQLTLEASKKDVIVDVAAQKETNQFTNDTAHLTLQTKMLEMRKIISTAEQELRNLKISINYDPLKIYAASNKIALYQNQLDFYKKLEEEQF